MNYFNWYKKGLIYILLGFNFSSCLPWDLPDECTEGLPSLSVSTGTTINATVGGNSANWSLVNSSGSVVLSSSGTNLSFNPTSLASGNYTIKAVGRNSCGFQFDVSQVYVKASFVEMVSIPGGTFQMGDTRGEGGIRFAGDSDELPVHSVTLSSFLMGKYEVTQSQWQAVMGNNPSSFSDCPNCPVEQVSWLEVITFCNALSDLEGKQRVYVINGENVTANWIANGYRLPTEAEWEYAAGGGATNRTRFGNGRDILDATEANFKATLQDKEPYSKEGPYRARTVIIGSFIPNRLGLYDMSGNVAEWCWDAPVGYSSGSVSNPRVGTLESRGPRILRGGSWFYSPYSCRVTARSGTGLFTASFGIGFRVVIQN